MHEGRREGCFSLPKQCRFGLRFKKNFFGEMHCFAIAVSFSFFSLVLAILIFLGQI